MQPVPCCRAPCWQVAGSRTPTPQCGCCCWERVNQARRTCSTRCPSVTAVTAVTAQPGAPHHHQAPLPFAYVQFNALRKRYIRYIRHIRYIRYLLNQVPLPFAYVQFNALLLHLFALVAPIGVCCFTESLSFAVITRWCDALAIGR